MKVLFDVPFKYECKITNFPNTLLSYTAPFFRFINYS